MTKGKHRRKAELRDARRNDDDLAALRDDVTREETLLADAEAAQAAAEDLARRLHDLEAARDRAVAMEVARLEPLVVELDQAVRQEEAHTGEIKDRWGDFVDLLVRTFGGGPRGIEAAMRIINNDDVRRTLRPDHQRNLDMGGVTRIQRARGQRRDVHDAVPNQEAVVLAWLRPSVIATVPGGAAYNENSDNRPDPRDPQVRELIVRANRAMKATAYSPDDDALCAWNFGQFINETIDDELGWGAVPDDDGHEWVSAAPANTAVRSAAEDSAEADPALLRAEDRWHNRLEAASMFPRPVDAIAMRWWYWAAARASSLLAGEADDGQPLAAMFEEAAHLVRGVPYWLPPGHLASYLDGDPLEATDLEDLRLPYPRVLVVPSEPIVIDPDPDGLSTEDLRKAYEFDVMTRDLHRKARNPDDLIDTLGEQLDQHVALSYFGAAVEAVALEADAAGRLTDRVVWCVAIPTRDRTAVLSRLVIPAWRSRSSRADVLDQLAAVVAWERWTEPVEDDPTPQRTGPGRRTRPGPVRVLDVRSRPADPATSVPTGRTLAPHTRRGHWRRQHYGPGGREIKRVRIHPVLVNAARGPLAPQVYKLPRTPAHPAADANGAP